MTHISTWGLWFVFGSCLGSFLNVCIYRMPREQSIVRPRSRCPHCKHLIQWFDNIPIVSFILLTGKCRHCHRSIAWNYPVVEALTGLSAVAVFHRFGVSLLGLIYLAFLASLIVASFVDLEFQIIPDEISVGGLVVGLALSVLVPALHGTESRWLSLGHSVLGLLVGGGTLYITGMIGDMIFRKESMGGGDIKLLAMAGSILGWKAVLLTFFIAPLFALIPGLAVLLFRRSHVIPYGPFLSLGLASALFFGDDLIRLSGMGETIRFLWEYSRWR